MISLAAARSLIAAKVPPLSAKAVNLTTAAGRSLRQAVSAREDLPGFDRSAMDGYAIAAGDRSPKFRVVAEIQPGSTPKGKIKRGECARIFTGAPIPAGASQVLKQEDVRVEGEFMIPLERNPERHIRRRGEDARRGDVLLKPGTWLGPGELALLASLGATRLKTSPAIRVAHFATGNELVAPDRKLRPGQIRDSNSILVASLVQQFGGEIVNQERVADDFDLLLKKSRALNKAYDVLLISGGASVGDYDFGKRLLSVLGFKIHFTAINLRPGKPLVFATRGKQAAFIIPGNPVSHLVTLHVAVRLAFEQMAGIEASWPLMKVRLVKPFDFHPGKRETFWPARVEIQNGKLVAQALHWQSSGDVTGLTGVNSLLQLEPGAKAPQPGDEVSVLLLELP